MICQQHCSLSEPCHSLESRLSDGAQGDLAAGMWCWHVSLMYTTYRGHH